jgi:predicted RNase H-like HicB family nuclease
MDSKEVAEVLFAEFGFKEFLTRDIRPDVLDRLTKLMEITEIDRHARNTKVGLGIGSLDGMDYTLGSGQKVKLVITRPENKHIPRRFQFTASTLAAYKPVDRAAATEFSVFETTYDVALIESEYGYSVSCPALPGCHSQGEDEEEALVNIREAITGWLMAESREVERRMLEMLDDYRKAGYAVKSATVSVTQIKG